MGAIQFAPRTRVPRLVTYDRTWRAWWVLKDGPATADGIQARLDALHDALLLHRSDDRQELLAALEELREVGMVTVDGAGVWSQVRLVPDAEPPAPKPATDLARPDVPCQVCGGRQYVGPYDMPCPACSVTADAFREVVRQFVQAYHNTFQQAAGGGSSNVPSVFAVWLRACDALGLNDRGEPR